MINNQQLANAASMLIEGIGITATNILSNQTSINETLTIANDEFVEDNFKELLTNTAWPLAEAKDLYETSGKELDAQKEQHSLEVDRLQRQLLTELIPAIKSIDTLSAKSLGYTYAKIIEEKEIEYETEAFTDIINVLENAKYKAYALANGHVYNATILNTQSIEFRSIYKAKELILEIDKQNTKPFNQINIKTTKVEKIIIGTSKDGIEYQYITYKQKAVYSSSIAVNESTDRFIRIIFIQKDNIPIEDGNFVHQAALSELTLGMRAQKTLLSFETPEYIINKTGSYIAIQDKKIGKGKISYEISINKKPYADITNKNVAINEFYENKLIAFDNTSSLEAEFVGTNELSIYDATTKWKIDAIGMYGWFKFNEEKTIDLGTKKLIVNGIILTGVITISPGIHKINLITDSYINYFNDRLRGDTVFEGNQIVAKDIYGNTHTVTDSMYPYNTKYLVEQASIGLGILVSDSILIPKEDGYSIEETDTKKYNIAFRSTIGNITTIKIKGTIDNSGQIQPTILKNIFVNIL